LTRGR